MDAFATNDCCIGAAGADGGLAAGCRVAEAHLVLLGTGLDALSVVEFEKSRYSPAQLLRISLNVWL